MKDETEKWMAEVEARAQAGTRPHYAIDQFGNPASTIRSYDVDVLFRLASEDVPRLLALLRELDAEVEILKAEPSAMPDASLNATEPDRYRLLTSKAFNRHVLNGVDRLVGFCVDSPGAAGYCDREVIWIADQIIDPERVIEYSVHECLHCIFPKLPEGKVQQFGGEIASFISGIFRAKGAVLPELRPLLNKGNVDQLFPGAAMREDAKT